MLTFILLQSVLGSIIRTRSTTDQCGIDQMEWTNLIVACNCMDPFSADCQMILIFAPTTGVSCKPNSDQNCKDFVIELAAKYKNSPSSADVCENGAPNYKVSQDLATTCEDGFFEKLAKNWFVTKN